MELPATDGQVCRRSEFHRPLRGFHEGGDEALAVLRHCADAGNEWDTVQSVELLAWLGRIDELRQCADASDGYAAGRLAQLLVGQGRVDKAIAVLRHCADGHCGGVHGRVEHGHGPGACGSPSGLRTRVYMSGANLLLIADPDRINPTKPMGGPNVVEIEPSVVVDNPMGRAMGAYA